MPSCSCWVLRGSMEILFTGLCNSATSQGNRPWPPRHKDSVTSLFLGRNPGPLGAKAQCSQLILAEFFIAWKDVQGCSRNSLQLLLSVQTASLSNTEGRENHLLYENQQNLWVWHCCLCLATEHLSCPTLPKESPSFWGTLVLFSSHSAHAGLRGRVSAELCCWDFFPLSICRKLLSRKQRWRHSKSQDALEILPQLSFLSLAKCFAGALIEMM